jgi:hypothetical protein
MSSLGITKYELANDGDDCVIIVESGMLERVTKNLKTWFYEMGFTMKVEKPVYVFEEIEFCQCKPVWTPTGYVMVRNPLKALSKDTTILTDVNSEDKLKAFLTVVGEGGLSLTGGIPVFQELYSYFKRMSSKKEKLKRHYSAFMATSGFSMMAKDMKLGYTEPDPKTRGSFWKAFGITPDMQCQMEEYYRNVQIDTSKIPIKSVGAHYPVWFPTAT